MLPTFSRGRPPSTYRQSPLFPHYLRRIIKTRTPFHKEDRLDFVFHPYSATLRVPHFKSRLQRNSPIPRGYKQGSRGQFNSWRQMDIEYTFWQMLHLCTSPKVVYQHTKYHKQTKNQWARDDPAFVVICSFLLAVAASAYCAAYDDSWGHAGLTVLSVVLVHFLLIGILLATCCWFLTNNYLREEMSSNTHAVEQHVEWLYAFDVHCNSFFPIFVALYVIQYFLSPLLLAHGFVPVLLSNLLFVVALSYYHYLNFLGYDVLPFLDKTTFFLYPIGFIIILSPFLVLAGFNPTRYILSFYFG